MITAWFDITGLGTSTDPLIPDFSSLGVGYWPAQMKIIEKSPTQFRVQYWPS